MKHAVIEYGSLIQELKSFTADEMQQLGLDADQYGEVSGGASVVAAYSEIPNEIPEGILVAVPPVMLARKLKKGAAVTFAKCHGMKVASRWTLPMIVEQFMLHHCEPGQCPGLFCVFKGLRTVDELDYISDSDPETFEWPPGDDCEPPDSFPPPPLSLKEKARIIRDFVADCDEGNLKEGHCMVCAQLYRDRDLLMFDSTRYSLEPLIEADVAVIERKARSTERISVEGPILDTRSSKVCVGCDDSLSKGRRPRNALANGLWLGDVPECLTCLTYTERLLVAKVRHNRSIVRVASGHRKMVANVVSYANPTPKIYKKLPPHRRELDDVLVFIFVGSAPPTEDDFRRTPMMVRRTKVLEALEWLQANHDEYWDVQIDHEALGSYKENKAPVEVLYHPIEDDEGNIIPTAASVHETDLEEGTETGPCPYRVHGLTGDAFAAMTVNQRKIHALRFLKEGGAALAVAHGDDPESIYRNPGLYPQMFPWLFPFGKGAIGQATLNGILSESSHKRWLLNYYDRRFQQDAQFVIVAFNHDQIKEGSSKSFILAKRRNFPSLAKKIRDINPAALRDISERMEAGGHVTPETDEERRCFALLDAIKSVSISVGGSLASKQADRTKVWSMSYAKGLPPWYITISPVDQKHPISIYRGDPSCNIFDAEILPASVRQKIASLNPVACARFFHFLVELFIKHVLGWNNERGGRYGRTSGYWGSVEQQGRQSLHGHFVVWIVGTPSPQEIRRRLLDEGGEFQKRLIAYLEDCQVGECLTGPLDKVAEALDSLERTDDSYEDPTLTLPTAPPDVECSSEGDCNCVECAKLQEWFQRFKLQVDDLILRSHIHTCYAKRETSKNSGNEAKVHATAKGCLNKDGRCTARFPRPTFEKSEVDPKDGHINIKKLESMMNTLTPELTYLMRCNTDVSSLLSGTAMKAVIGYVTDYITKPSLKTYQIFSTSYDVFERHNSLLSPDLTGDDALNAGRKLIMKTVNSLTSKIEIGAPMAALHLLGIPDSYCSHTFVPFYWKSFFNYVWRTWDAFEKGLDRGDDMEDELPTQQQGVGFSEDGSSESEDGDEEIEPEKDDITPDEGNEVVPIHQNSGSFIGKSSLDDYRARPRKYEKISLYDWIQCAVRTTKSQLRKMGAEKMRQYHHYQESHPLHRSHVVTVDPSRRQTVIPNFLGPLLPRKDEGDLDEWACAMLTIFKPWRKPLDLKAAGASWKETYAGQAFTDRERRLISNLNLRYECYDARDDFQQQIKNLPIHGSAQENVEGVGFEDGDEENDDIYGIDECEAEKRMDESDDRMNEPRSECARKSLDTLSRAGWRLGDNQRGVFHDDWEKIKVTKKLSGDQWKKVVDNTRKKILQSKYGGIILNRPGEDGDETEAESAWHAIKKRKIVFVMPGSYLTKDFHLFNSEAVKSNQELLNSIKGRYTFNYEQEKAFNIVCNHALSGGSEQLKMYIGGMGGTGKSRVLKGIIDFFKGRKEEYRIVVLAPTGNAASLIDGSTYHSYLKIFPGEREQDIPKRVDELRTQLECVNYIFMDEISMMSCYDMYRISRRLCDARNRADLPFGGINIIFAGDFAQLPPTTGHSLYSRKVSEYQTPRQNLSEQHNSIGKRAWMQITSVVILKKNMRQSEESDEDTKFRKALENLRYFNCDDDDIQFLRSRVAEANPRIDLNDEKFRFASIITSLNADKDGYNELYSERFAEESGRSLHSFYSIDKPVSDKLSRTPKRGRRIRLTYMDRNTQEKLWSMPSHTSKLVAGRLILCLGMPVCIRYNVATELCITKGQEGTVAGWVAHRHPVWKDHDCLDVLFVKLTNPPKKIKIPYLPENVVPITKISTTMRAKTGVDDRDFACISRHQVPVLPNFSMTDYSSQAKSREINVVDIGQCRSFQAIYVCLSRGTSAAGTVILEDFADSDVRGVLDKDLAMEYRALKHLDEITDLVYRNELPEGILHTGRMDTLKAYKEWKGIVDGNDDDESQHKDSVQTGKRKERNECPSQNLEHDAKRRRTQVSNQGVFRRRTAGANSSPQGPSWDWSDPSCAYDTIVCIIFNLCQWEKKWMAFMTNSGVPILQRMSRDVEDVLAGYLEVTDVRNAFRHMIRGVAGPEFAAGRREYDIRGILFSMVGWSNLEAPLALICEAIPERGAGSVLPSRTWELLVAIHKNAMDVGNVRWI
ncbi:hypothetical protein CC1G_04093 [Coprinopsis cinerea okayama7|uniref:ATP-dependent DNA helicase n=1 Tax=Coprinopsis cinerea (strain Okayama-7 / 130 / ATCC MYA-4618 / FGSC 9003) TaxID=240176 RepID=A8NVY4_COPC7|nr:hypothetical protein CC1G_04093 [Coprinopsis cinerea okayama7\|eukprot:XP_001836780.2 hypothetical protein CC1G_04093 [Coprinopsis cinerea okayama7\